MCCNELSKCTGAIPRKALGPVGMARFLQQFDVGSDDYTRDREQWLKDLNVKGVVKEIKEQRRRGG